MLNYVRQCNICKISKILVISYNALSILMGNEFVLILLILLHIEVYVTITQTVWYLRYKLDCDTVVIAKCILPRRPLDDNRLPMYSSSKYFDYGPI